MLCGFRFVDTIVEKMKNSVGRLIKTIAHDEIFGNEDDFGEQLCTINIEVSKKQWDAEKYLTEKDLQRAKAILTSNLLIRNRFIGFHSIPPINLYMYRDHPEICSIIPAMTPYVLVQSIRYFVDLNPYYTFCAIRKSQHEKKESLIALLYDLLDAQAKTANSLLDYIELGYAVQQEKRESAFTKEELDLEGKATYLIAKLKAFIEKLMALVGAIYGDLSIDSLKKHGYRVKKIKSLVETNYGTIPYHDLFFDYIKAETFEFLNNYRNAIFHKKGASDMQPHSFVGKEFDETPIRKLLELFIKHHQMNAIALISALGIMTDKLVRMETATKRFVILMDMIALTNKLWPDKREKQISMLPFILKETAGIYREYFKIDIDKNC